MPFKKGDMVEVTTPTIVVVEGQTEGLSLWHARGVILAKKRFPSAQVQVDFGANGIHWLFEDTISKV